MTKPLSPTPVLLAAAILALPAAGDAAKPAARPATAAAKPAPPAAPPEPWLATPFAGEPSEVLRAAQAAPVPEKNQDASILGLLEEGHFRFDEKGRQVYRYRFVYRILTTEGAESWDAIDAEWSPWHEERPKLRARVIGPTGRLFWLDESTISESPSADPAEEIYSDRRVLRAPLPGIAVGAFVEEEIVTTETAPFFDAGVVQSFFFGKTFPMRRTRLVLEAPASFPLRAVVRDVPGLEPKRTELPGGFVRWTYEAGPQEALDAREPGLPPDDAGWPKVTFVTGTSWAHVALRYSEIVDAAIAKTDVRALAKEATKGAKGNAEVIARLLAKVKKDLRYTAMELGEGSIVPRTPREALSNKYGDCKDQATYLVALLRASGIPANVALLKTGPGRDAERDLPGLGGFDHAITVIPGPPTVWIDPTDPYSRAGVLPAADQGRLALIAAPTTTGLVPTPETGVELATEIETREVFLAEDGPSRIVETNEATGVLDAELRGAWDGQMKDVREALEDYVERAYLAEKLGEVTMGAPLDLEKPFRLRVEALEAGRAATDEEEAVVAIIPWGLTGRLPSIFQPTEEEIEGEGDGKVDEPPDPKDPRQRPRTKDYYLRMSWASEWRYRIVPPPGFAVKPFPELTIPDLSPAKLTAAFATTPKGEVTATFRFEVPQRRIPVARFEAIRKGLRELRRTGAVLVRFEQVAQAHIAHGRIREGFDEYRRLQALHPKEALHHVQYAGALLAAGFGAEAREAAKKATVVEPKSADAWRSLAWTLQHDALGRRFGRGWDRAGSIAAYRKAKELDPKDVAARADLAIVLEHDAEGHRYGEKADLPAAIAEYEAIRKELDDRTFDANLLGSCLHARRWDDLARLAKDADADTDRDAYLVLVAAMKEGTGAAVREANRKTPDAAKKRALLERVANSMIRLRSYPEAAALLEEAAKGSANAAPLRRQAELIRKLRPHEKMEFAADDPAALIRKMVIAAAEATPEDHKALEALILPASRKAMLGDEKERAKRIRDTARAFRGQGGDGGLPPDMVIDAALGGAETLVDGNEANGWRVRMTFSASGPEITTASWVVKTPEGLRILASEDELERLGAEALRRVDAGQPAAAKVLLDWAREELQVLGGEDPLRGSSFPRVWTKGQEASDDEIRTAAALLLLRGDDRAPAIPILRKALAAPGLSAERTRDLESGLASALLGEEKFAELEPVTARLVAAEPKSGIAFSLRTTALARLGRWDQLRGEAEARLAKDAEDHAAISAMMAVWEQKGDYAAIDRTLRPLSENGKANAEELNGLAWNALFLDRSDAASIELARRAAEMLDRQSSSILHTLATLYAEAGRPLEARTTILEAIDVAGDDEPQPHDWYVFGRIAENCGLSASAAEAYRKVTKPDAGRPTASSTWELARRRLAVLASGKK